MSSTTDCNNMTSFAADSELEAWAQPIIDVDSSRIVAAELLARVRMSNDRLIYPADFLKLLLENEKTLCLDAKMVQFAARFLGDHPEFPLDFLSVNVDAIHIASGAVVDIVIAELASTGADPRRLMIEATEYHDHNDTDGWRRNIDALRALGVRVALDDFGSGFSTINRLLETEIDLIKIDGAMISQCERRGCAPLLRGIADFASQMNLDIVAEGVETFDHLDLARSTGISSVQGFLYGHACPLAELPSFFAEGGVVVPPDERGMYQRAAVAA